MVDKHILNKGECMDNTSTAPTIPSPAYDLFAVGATVWWTDVAMYHGHEHSSGVFKVVKAPEIDKDFTLEDAHEDGVYLLQNEHGGECEAYHHELRLATLDDMNTGN